VFSAVATDGERRGTTPLSSFLFTFTSVVRRALRRVRALSDRVRRPTDPNMCGAYRRQRWGRPRRRAGWSQQLAGENLATTEPREYVVGLRAKRDVAIVFGRPRCCLLTDAWARSGPYPHSDPFGSARREEHARAPRRFTDDNNARRRAHPPSGTRPTAIFYGRPLLLE